MKDNTKPSSEYDRGYAVGRRRGETEIKDIGPMGVSQWRNHGLKYGYDIYFHDKRDEKLKSLHKAVIEGWFGTRNRVELIIRLEEILK